MEYTSIEELLIFREFLSDPIMQAVNCYMENKNPKDGSFITGSLIAYAEKNGLTGAIWKQFLLNKLCDGSNTAAAAIEYAGTYGNGLRTVVEHDMAILWPYLEASAGELFGYEWLDRYEPAETKDDVCLTALGQAMKECTTAAEGAVALLAHYKQYGRGKLAKYMAFRINSKGELVGIDDFPCFLWEDILSYQAQKEKLLTNTINFMENREANNVLLTGARGTGKSTAVKALVYRYHHDGLRLIQLQRGQLESLPGLMEQLSLIKSKKFILFLDDLSFDENEKEYKYLKSAIDGGVSPQPSNVLIYATSNRRHLLKETWRDRNDELDEVYRDDSTNESISLSDRFGLIIHYAAPTQDEYLAIIDHELRKAGIALDKKELRILGLRWEMEHSGRNGRIARQFVKWYLGNKK